MKAGIDFVRSTIIGGVFFLIPIAAVLIVIGKLVGLLKGVANRVVPFLPMESTTGVVVLNLVALLLVLFFCLLAGLAARSKAGETVRQRLEDVLLATLPGYSFVKGLTDNMRQSDELSENFIPIAVRLDDYSQIAFEIERAERIVVVYLPGAPNPWSGTVAYLDPDRVRRLKMSVPAALRNIRMLGKGSKDYLQSNGPMFESGESDGT